MLELHKQPILRGALPGYTEQGLCVPPDRTGLLLRHLLTLLPKLPKREKGSGAKCPQKNPPMIKKEGGEKKWYCPDCRSVNSPLRGQTLQLPSGGVSPLHGHRSNNTQGYDTNNLFKGNSLV